LYKTLNLIGLERP